MITKEETKRRNYINLYVVGFAVLLLILVIVLFAYPVNAQEGFLGTFEQGQCVNLIQTCSDCTFNNITSVMYPNSTQALGQVAMTKSNTNYNYTFCSTSVNGIYNVNGKGNANGELSIWVYDFEISPSGQSGSSNTSYFIFIIGLIYVIALFGFFGKNIPMSILGGMAMMGLGVYIINEGLIVYRDWLTVYFAYVTIGLGFMIAAWAFLEQLDVL